ncbi:MAG: V-type ATP synthase subunit A [Candidatus Brocadiaceae bacterium]|nr:V-type ATP synthase subunit A [Candidatus Brocadiaceae bacterium]
MNASGAENGTVVRVSGPIVDARGLRGVEAYEVVRVGPQRHIGEVIKLSGDVATIQVYEQTTGLRPGDAVERTGRPLSVDLGPGLLGGIFDGVQRPLGALAERFGPYLGAGQDLSPIDADRQWEFTPRVEPGESLVPGRLFGVVQETPAVEHRLLVPPGVHGRVASVRPAGRYGVNDVLVESAEAGVPGLSMVQRWPVRRARPYGSRAAGRAVMVTGQRVIDTLFPIARGGAAAVPGDFGTGKTILQQQLAKWIEADIVVYVGCGERGNEMADILRQFPRLTDPRTGRSLMERTVLIANTSNMPVAAREVSIYTGITLAEYYRDMGYHVALMADSTSRWAEALREASSRLEEMPAEEGFPAYLAARLAEFYERAGQVETLEGREGSVTVVGAVSPPGGDFSEPVTQHTTRFTRCLWALDPALAHARHYPAISWLDSYSQYVDDLADWWRRLSPDWAARREEMVRLLSEEEKLQQIVRLVGPDVLPDAQRLILLVAEMFKNGFLRQNALDPIDTFCSPIKQVMLLTAFVTFYRRAQDIIRRGAPIARIREMEAVGELQRAASRIPNDDQDALRALLSRLDEQLGELEREYAP